LAIASTNPEFANRVQVKLGRSLRVQTDPRLLCDIMGALIDHALRRTPRDAPVEVHELTEASTSQPVLIVSAKAPWLIPEDRAMLSGDASPRGFEPTEIAMFVARAAAALLGATLAVDPEGAVSRVSIQVRLPPVMSAG
jgi:hypothetical protein